MGKAAMILVAGFVLASTFVTTNTLQGLNAGTRAEAAYQHDVVARNAAVTGYQVARQQLADAFTSSTLSRTYDGAVYDVEVSVSGDLADVVSEGRITDGAGVVHRYTVHARVERTGGGLPASVPPFMEYALLTEGDHVLKGNIKGRVYPPGSALNANFRTNGDLEVRGNAAGVQGFGFYAGSATARPSKALEGTFEPNVNPEGASSVQHVPEIEIPAFDAAAYLGRVGADRTSTGDVTLSGSLELNGTREDPFVWYVDGSLRASGGVTVSGYVMFIVEGDIDLRGNVDLGASGYAGNESSVALYAGGDVDLRGTVQVHGQIYAGGDLIFRGTPDLYGSATGRGSAELSGTPTFHYRPASPALTTIWQDPPPQTLALTYYGEW